MKCSAINFNSYNTYLDNPFVYSCLQWQKLYQWSLYERKILLYAFYYTQEQLTQTSPGRFREMFLKASFLPKSSQWTSSWASLTMRRAMTMASSLPGMVRKSLGNLHDCILYKQVLDQFLTSSKLSNKTQHID